jgi:hypothetical protein
VVLRTLDVRERAACADQNTLNFHYVLQRLTLKNGEFNP